ncbi:YfjI family protein [Ferroacidibacillus organovorans]|uniref:DUF3987 domain-containing protein n=1 Tax=Ferroacidibacillus organovorans TaxID=1765683 RepID=A0A101XRL2_9BACL|nr:YfjI family protein [Ferroacidibacillus organovorans]KUO95206.1 hypothetical protein ATW55_15360 [Ferroacidibacillus organovorans]KUO96251.1 hypothetical protein ATW55_03250 [Ferroacidibacillus organovorans]
MSRDTAKRLSEEQEWQRNQGSRRADIPPVPLRQMPVEPFPINVFPERLRCFITEAAKSLNCPPDFVALSMLSVAGSCIGTSAAIRAKADWIEFARIWSIILGDPGSGKTPPLELVMHPIHEWQNKRADEYKRALEDYKKALAAWEQNHEGKRPAQPEMEQAFTTDTTLEALADLLEIRPRGVLLYQDEAAGFITSFNQYKGGRGNDRQRALTLWSGSPITLNRKNRKLHIPKPFVCFLGGMQPAVLTDLRGEMSERDGFIHRFLFVYPDPLPLRRTSEELSNESRTAWDTTCQALMEYTSCEDGSPRIVNFTTDGLASWHDWLDAHYAEQNADDFLYHLRGPWAKLQSYTLRLALILHMLRVVCNDIEDMIDVDAETMARTGALMKYLKSHARRIYANLRDTPSERRMMQVAQWLQRKGGIASDQDILKAQVAGLKTADDTRRLLETMNQRGHVTLTPDPGGRKKIIVNLVTDQIDG